MEEYHTMRQKNHNKENRFHPPLFSCYCLPDDRFYIMRCTDKHRNTERTFCPPGSVAFAALTTYLILHDAPKNVERLQNNFVPPGSINIAALMIEHYEQKKEYNEPMDARKGFKKNSGIFNEEILYYHGQVRIFSDKKLAQGKIVKVTNPKAVLTLFTIECGINYVWYLEVDLFWR